MSITARASDLVKAVMVFFIGWIFALVSWYMIPPLANLTTDQTLKAIFYIGLLAVDVLVIIVAPIVMIMQGSNKDEVNQ